MLGTELNENKDEGFYFWKRRALLTLSSNEKAFHNAHANKLAAMTVFDKPRVWITVSNNHHILYFLVCVLWAHSFECFCIRMSNLKKYQSKDYSQRKNYMIICIIKWLVMENIIRKPNFCDLKNISK